MVSAPSAAVPLFAVYDPKDLRLPARNIDSEWHVVANQSEPRHCFYREEVHADNRPPLCERSAQQLSEQQRAWLSLSHRQRLDWHLQSKLFAARALRAAEARRAGNAQSAGER